jgi:hypothetical protein
MESKGVFLRFIVMVMLLVSMGFTKDISYDFHLSNKNPYQNEAIFLDVNVTQEDERVVMLFKFNLQQSKEYTFHQIDFKENDKYHHLKHQYKYLIYPKQVGKVAIKFEMIKSLTDDDKVAYAISGDRDNVKGLVKKDINVKLEPLILKVEKLPMDTVLVGEYTLKYLIDKTSTKAYEPIHLKVTLKGKGDIPPLELFPKSIMYHLFTQKPKIKKLHSSKGTYSSVEWDYAISAKEDFILPKVGLKVFNPESKKVYELVLPSQSIHVLPIAKTSLLDKEDTPSIVSSDGWWSWLGWFFSYMAVFMAGFLIPRDILKRTWGKKKSTTIKDEVAEAKTDKELLKVLLARNNVNDKEAIRLLEESLYRGKKHSLVKIKEYL